MRKTALFSLILFAFSCEDKVAKDVVMFEKIINNSSHDYAQSVLEASDGGYVILGTTFIGPINYDIWMIKTDMNGEILWNKKFGGDRVDFGESVFQTGDDGYIITGKKGTGIGIDQDVYLIKTNSDGIVEWEETFGGGKEDWGFSVQQTDDHGYIIGGHTWSKGNGAADIYVIKTNSLGKREWEQTYGGKYWDSGQSIKQTVDGGFITVGEIGWNVGLIKINPNGEQEWNMVLGDTSQISYEFPEDVIQTQDGGYIIVGRRQIYGLSQNCLVIKTNAKGEVEWEKVFGGDKDEAGHAIQQTEDGNYIIVGFSNSFGENQDVWLLKIDSNGKEIWSKYFDSNEKDYGEDVKETKDGGFIITGYKHSRISYTPSILLIKTDSEGNTEPFK